MRVDPTITLGIPSGRDASWILNILSVLKRPPFEVKVLIARWIKAPLAEKELILFNNFFPTEEVFSLEKYTPMMRNVIIKNANTTHILFLDDDMVPKANLLEQSYIISKNNPTTVYQGYPYRVANNNKWLARMEGKLYKKGYSSYVKGDEVTLLDARILLAPLKIFQETPFDETMIFGGGEGRQLSETLKNKGIQLLLARNLGASHINRETVFDLFIQKRAHGRGRGHTLFTSGPGELGWQQYIKKYLTRHFKVPVVEWSNKEITLDELFYTLATNIVFWCGTIEELTRSYLRSYVRKMFKFNLF